MGSWLLWQIWGYFFGHVRLYSRAHGLQYACNPYLVPFFFENSDRALGLRQRAQDFLFLLSTNPLLYEHVISDQFIT